MAMKKPKFRKGQVVAIDTTILCASYGKVNRIHYVDGERDLVEHPVPHVGAAILDVHGFWYDAPATEPWNWCHESRLRPLTLAERGGRRRG